MVGYKWSVRNNAEGTIDGTSHNMPNLPLIQKNYHSNYNQDSCSGDETSNKSVQYYHRHKNSLIGNSHVSNKFSYGGGLEHKLVSYFTTAENRILKPDVSYKEYQFTNRDHPDSSSYTSKLARRRSERSKRMNSFGKINDNIKRFPYD